MYRSINLLAVLATAGIIALKTMDISSLLPDPREWMPPYVEHNMHDYYAFKAQFGDTLASLENAEISLGEAHRRVKSASMKYWPNYLSNLKLADQGETTDERIAFNLVGHIQCLSEFGKVTPLRVADLESELAQFLMQECATHLRTGANER